MKRSGENGNIPEGWRLVRLGDVAEVVTGNTPSRDMHEYYGGTVPWVKPSDLASSRLVDSSEEGLTEAGVTVAKRVPQNCILVSCIGTIGEVAISRVPLCFNQQINALIPNDSVWPPFLYWACSAQSNYLLSISAKTAVPILNKSEFSAVSILLPSLPEQQAIATVLDSIDDAIEGAEAVIAATEQLRDSLLHRLLTSGVPGWHTEWKDVPGLGTIPADWEVVRLGEVAEVQTGRAVNRKSSRGGSLEVPYLSVANVKDGYLDLGAVKTMQISGNEVERYRLKSGDVLFTEGGDADKLGRGTVWKDEIPLCLHQNHIFAVRPHDGVLLAEYLAFFAASGFGKKYFLGAAKQTTNLASVNSTQLREMPLPLPSIREQNMVVGLLSAAGNSHQRASGERDTLKLLKEATADALLTGRVRVKGGTR